MSQPRQFCVLVRGYNSVTYVACSASVARYQAYLSFCDAVRRVPFRQFLDMSSVLHLGVQS